MANGLNKDPRPGIATLICGLMLFACAGSPQKSGLDHAAIVTIREGDTLAGLARAYLSDPHKSYIIAEFNKKTSIAPGQKIVIPQKPFNRGGLSKSGFQTVTVLRYKNFFRRQKGTNGVIHQVFESQLAFLKREGYHVVTMTKLLDFLDFKDQLPAKSVVITIDDNRDSVLNVAYPLLKKYNFPATLFVQTDIIGKQDALTWPQVRHLSRAGLDIQCRSATFGDLETLRIKKNFNHYIKQLDGELSRLKAAMQSELGKSCQYLAYPEGPNNPIMAAFAKKHAFRAGFMSHGKSNPFFVSNHRIGRSTVFGDSDLNKFKQQLIVFETMELK